MKLHLPKLLLTAVLAACVMSSQAWATSDATDNSGWGKITDDSGKAANDSYGIGDKTITSIDTADSTQTSGGLFIRSNNSVGTATVGTLNVNRDLTIDGWWEEDPTHPEFSSLTITNLTFTGASNLAVADNNTVSIDTLSKKNDQTVTMTGNTTVTSVFEMTNGGVVNFNSGTHTIEKMDIHCGLNNGSPSSTETINIHGAKVKITKDDEVLTSTGGVGVVLGHWHNGNVFFNVGGTSESVFDVSGAHIRMSWDSNSTLNILQNGVVYAKGINFANASDNAVVNVSGGRLNLGSSGISSQRDVASSYTRALNLTTGTLGALAETVNIATGTTTIGGEFTIDTAIVDAAGVATGGTATITFANGVVMTNDTSLTIKGGGTVGFGASPLAITTTISVLDDTKLDLTGGITVDAVYHNLTPSGEGIAPYYSLDGTADGKNSSGNGFIVAEGGDFILFDGYVWNGTVDGFTVSKDGTDTILTTPDAVSKDYYITTSEVDVSSDLNADNYVVQGGTMNLTSGTVAVDYTSGAIAMANGTGINIDSEDNLTEIIKNTTGTGTINVTSNAQIGTNEGGTTTSSFAGTISVKSGILYFGDADATNNTPQVQLGSATVELAGGTMEIFSGASSLGKISATVDSVLGLFEVKDSNGAADFNVGEVSVAKDKTLTITSGSRGDAWHARVNVGALTGEGNLLINTEQASRRTYNISTIGTAEKAFGNITNKETMNLGADASSLLNMGDVTNTGTLSIVGQLAGTSTISGGTINVKDGTSVAVTGDITFGSEVTLEGALSNTGTLTFSTSVDLSNGLTNTGTVNIKAGYSATGTLTNAGIFNLEGDVVISDFSQLEDTGTVSYSDGEDGYITSATYYVVKSAEATDSVTLNGESTLYYGSTAMGSIATNGNNLTIAINNENADSGVYFVRTKDLEVNGLEDNAAVNATGYDVAAGRTLTIAADQSDTMTAGKILAETTGAGNITLSTNAALDDTSTQATGTLTIDNGAVLNVGNGSSDTSKISSFNAVTLIGSTLNLNGAAQEVKSLTVGQAESDGSGESTVTTKSTLIVQNPNAQHQTYTLSGTTTLYEDLDIATGDEHGTVAIEKLTGSKDLSISGGHATWGATAVKVAKLVDYTGTISVDNGGRDAATQPDISPLFTHVEFVKGAFTTLEGLEVSNNAYALVHANNSSTIKALTLKNGTLKLNPYGPFTYTLTDVNVGGTGTISLLNEAGAGGYQGQIDIGSLKNAEGSATSTLNITSANNTSMRSIVNVNGGDFDGTISVTGSSTDTGRKIALNINDATVAQDAEIKLHGNGSHVALGIGTSKVTVKGISDAEGATGTMKIVSGAQAYGYSAEFSAADNTTRTLEVNTAGGSYTTSATVGMNLNLVKSGEGTQNFSGDMSSFNGTVEVSGGTLGFTNAAAGASTSLTNLTLSGGKLDVTGTLTLTNVTVDLSQYTAGTEFELVKAGAYGDGSNFDWTLSNTDAVGNYTVALEKKDNSVWLTWDEVTSITTTVDGYSFNEDKTMLTLTVDLKDGEILSDNMSVIIEGFGENVLAGILGEVGANAMVGITIKDTLDGDVGIVGNSTGNVAFAGPFEEPYKGELVGSNWQYNVSYIPEPTTATLSLLALVGLAARRRRKA